MSIDHWNAAGFRRSVRLRHFVPICMICAVTVSAMQPVRAEASASPQHAGFGGAAQARLAEVERNLEAAGSGSLSATERINMLVNGLRRELANPASEMSAMPEPNPFFNLNDAILGMYLRGLASVGDRRALITTAQSETDVDVRNLLYIASANVESKSGNEDQDATSHGLLDALKSSANDYTRARAAQALGETTPANSAMRADVVSALKHALNDPASRVTDPRLLSPNTVVPPFHIVRVAAAGALRKLGINARRQDDGSYTLLSADDSPDAVWLTARSFLEGRGYSVTWDPSAKRLEGTRGSSVIRLWAGRNTAEINGHTVTLTAAPRIVSSSLRVPETLEAVLADGGKADG
jgi:hypothetical protein